MGLRRTIHLILFMLLMLQGAFGQTMPNACPGSRVRYSTSGLPNSVFNWTVTGGTIINNYNDSVDIQWGVTPGNYTLSVVEVGPTMEYSIVHGPYPVRLRGRL